MKFTSTLLAISVITLLSSCVSSKVHKDLQSRYDQLDSEARKLRATNADYKVEVTELKDAISKLRNDQDRLVADTTRLGNEKRTLAQKYDKLSQQYDYMVENNSSLMAASAQENKALLEQLELIQNKLQAKEDSLQIREKRVNELEAALSRKDSAMNYVRNKLADALLGFEGKGLSIYTKDGQVYVSMENSLLFASGSYAVSKRGKEALVNIAGVLADNPDVNVLVEGHTDDDPYKGTGLIKDNWDLSVMRATAVVRILNDGADLNKQQITAAGRGEYLPLVPNDSQENKAKNRRTEIILTPDLSELAELLEAN
jgi:chemotaxis protein MotB